MKKILLSAAPFLIAAAVLFYANGGLSAPRPVKAGQPSHAPEFTLTDLHGQRVRMSDLRGKVVVLNFWATWCPPCRHEIPWFVELQEQYGAEGLRIVGVSMDSTGPHAVAEFAKKMGINYSVVMSDGRIEREYGGVNVLPTTFFIARDGRMVSYVPGLVRRSALEEQIKSLLRAK